MLERLRVLGPLLGVLAMLAGCRLYEPDRYQRLHLPAGAPRTRVLMIGDSLTYYNDLPGLLEQMSAGEKAPAQVEKRTTPLASLRWHWEMDDSAELVRGGRWDYVVLQDFSRKPATDPADCLRAFQQFGEQLRRGGTGKPVIFQNWTRRGMETDYAPMLHTYQAIQQTTGGLFAPVGAAWRICAAEAPEISLLLDDRHPTDEGSYLAACVLYDVIYGKKSELLAPPANVPGPKVRPEVLARLRGFADRAVYAPAN